MLAGRIFVGVEFLRYNFSITVSVIITVYKNTVLVSVNVLLKFKEKLQFKEKHLFKKERN